MANVRWVGVFLMVGGLVLLGLSVADGVWVRAESALRPMETEALLDKPTPVTPPGRTMSATLAAASFTLTPYPLPVATPMLRRGSPPVRLRIPAIALDVPVLPVTPTVQTLDGLEVQVWPVPDRKAAGWMVGTALVGEGNTVLNGHNTSRGEVFRDVYRLTKGAMIVVEDAEGETHGFRVANVMVVPEGGVSATARLENARFILPTPDVRLTLITCHPYGSTRYRLIVVALLDAETCPQGCS